VLGAGFLEKVYENSLAIEIGKAGMKVKQQYPLNVYYEGNIVGDYFADLLVEDKVIVELKIADEISRVHYMQIYNYLRASGLRVGLVLGFGDKGVAVRRVDMS